MLLGYTDMPPDRSLLLREVLENLDQSSSARVSAAWAACRLFCNIGQRQTCAYAPLLTENGRGEEVTDQERPPYVYWTVHIHLAVHNQQRQHKLKYLFTLSDERSWQVEMRGELERSGLQLPHSLLPKAREASSSAWRSKLEFRSLTPCLKLHISHYHFMGRTCRK